MGKSMDRLDEEGEDDCSGCDIYGTGSVSAGTVEILHQQNLVGDRDNMLHPFEPPSLRKVVPQLPPLLTTRRIVTYN
jgi:hypothetical protein